MTSITEGVTREQPHVANTYHELEPATKQNSRIGTHTLVAENERFCPVRERQYAGSASLLTGWRNRCYGLRGCFPLTGVLSLRGRLFPMSGSLHCIGTATAHQWTLVT